jgi:hypothetical protein
MPTGTALPLVKARVAMKLAAVKSIGTAIRSGWPRVRTARNIREITPKPEINWKAPILRFPVGPANGSLRRQKRSLPAARELGQIPTLVAAGAAQCEGFEEGQAAVRSHHVVVGDVDRGETAPM